MKKYHNFKISWSTLTYYIISQIGHLIFRYIQIIVSLYFRVWYVEVDLKFLDNQGKVSFHSIPYCTLKKKLKIFA